MCSCLGGSVIEPEDAGAEHAEKRGEWCEFMDKCCSSVAGIFLFDEEPFFGEHSQIRLVEIEVNSTFREG